VVPYEGRLGEQQWARLWVQLRATLGKARPWARLAEECSARSADGSKASNSKPRNNKPHSNSNKRNGKNTSVRLARAWTRGGIA
jgi:hypothetical protein